VNFPLPPSAQQACVRALAGAAERVGFDVPLSRYSHGQVISLIEAVLTAYEALLHKGMPSPTPPPVDFFDDIPFDLGHDAMTTDFLRRVVPSHADLMFFMDGRENCAHEFSTTRLPDADDRPRDEARWIFPVKAHRPDEVLQVEVADA